MYFLLGDAERHTPELDFQVGSGCIVMRQGGGKGCLLRAGDERAFEHGIGFHELHVDRFVRRHTRRIIRLDQVVDRRVGGTGPRTDQSSRIMKLPPDPDSHARFLQKLPAKCVMGCLAVIDSTTWIFPHEDLGDVFGGHKNLAIAQQESVDTVVLWMGHQASAEGIRVMKEHLL